MSGFTITKSQDQLLSVSISDSVVVDCTLVSSRSDFFSGLFRMEGRGPRRLNSFKFPGAFAPFTEAQFYFILCVLNTASSLIPLYNLDFDFFDIPALIALTDYFQAPFLFDYYLANYFTLQKAHHVLVPLASVRGWHHAHTRYCTDMLFHYAGLPLSVIQESVRSRSDPSRFVTHPLRNTIRNYRRKVTHFWQTRIRLSVTRAPCPVCQLMIRWTSRICGPFAEVQFFPCCMRLVHATCFQEFLQSSYGQPAQCPGCVTLWTAGFCRTDDDDPVSSYNRIASLRVAHVSRYHPRFFRIYAHYRFPDDPVDYNHLMF